MMRRKKKMSKFKVGDEVKVIKSNMLWSDSEIGKRGVITAVNDLLPYPYRIQGIEQSWRDDELKLVQPKQFTKADLKERYIVVTRNGNEYVVMNKVRAIGISNGEFNCKYIEFKNYNNNLTDKNKSVWDIVQILKPHYDKLWERTEELPKKMTVAEIQKELGYKVEIIE
jgi:hypothetical protein